MELAMAARKEEYWAGMRVLAIDEDRVCLKILEAKLRGFNYDVTPAKDGKTALRALEKAREPFDLVISELYMPDMDALDLIRRIALGMGIPVIVLSAYEDTEMVRNALISSGACSYLAKPACADQLKNIWQHVLRRKRELARNHKSRCNTVADQRIKTGIAEAEQGAKSTRKNSRTKRNEGDDDSDGKKQRLRWTKELHGKFVEAIHQLGTGTDKVAPREICSMMDVDNIGTKNIGSHLQKYRTHLKRSSDPKARAAIKWTSYYNTSNSMLPSSNSNNRLATPSIQPRTIKHGGSTFKDVLPTLQDESHKSEDHAKALRDLLVKTNQGKASSHRDYSFGNLIDKQMLEPVNPFPMQLPQLVNQSSIGNFNNFWQNVASSKFPDILNKDGTSLGPSNVNANVNIPKINQHASFAGASSGQVQMSLNGLHNQQVPDPMAASNTSSVQLLNGNFAPGRSTSSISLPNLQTCNSVMPTQLVNGFSNSSALPNIEADNYVVPAQMLNAGDVVGTTPPAQEGTADQQALDGQLNDNAEYSMDDIFSFLDQNALEDDPLLQNPIEDDAVLMDFNEDNDLFKNLIEHDSLLENFNEDDPLLNGDWF